MQQASMPVWLARMYGILFALLPWSFEWSFGTWKLTVPAEPLIALAGAGLLIAAIRQKKWPIQPGWAWVPLAWVAWLVLAAACSTMPLVSWKYVLVEVGQWWVFFAGIWLWPEQWSQCFRWLAWSMAGVVVYTVLHHAGYGFNGDQAVLAPIPFFDNHTAYSAVLVMTLVSSNANSSSNSNSTRCTPLNLNLYLKFILGGLALLLAFSRATWLSVFAAGLAGVLLLYRAQWRRYVPLLLLGALGVGFYWSKIDTRNGRQVSSLERMNRYACARRMVADRPWTGFGPGTFQFQYLPYQRPEEMTRISITEPIRERNPSNYGRGGGAHSEYFQAMAELGWPGFVLWCLLMAGTLLAGWYQYDRTGRRYYLWTTLSLLTFAVHGLMNNFLHDARVAALFWGQMAVILAVWRGNGPGKPPEKA